MDEICDWRKSFSWIPNIRIWIPCSRIMQEIRAVGLKSEPFNQDHKAQISSLFF